MKKIVFYLFLFLFFSCSKEELRQEFVVQEIDELRIQDSLNFFLTIPRLAEINQEGVLVSFDKGQEEFQLFDLNSSKLIKRVPVQFFGPNSISENIFSSMLFNGNILISTAESIAVLDLNGKKIKEVFFDDILLELELVDKRISVIYRSNWDPITGEVYLWIKDFNSHKNKFQSYDSEIQLVKYSVINETSEVISLEVPEELIENNSGYYTSIPPLISVNGGRLVYAFSFLPEVFYFDLNTREKLKYSIIPSHFLKRDPISYQEYIDSNGSENESFTQFIDLIFDPSTNLIIRKSRNYQEGRAIGKDLYTVIQLSGYWGEIDFEEKIGRLLPGEKQTFALSNDNQNEDMLRYFSIKITEE